MTGSPEFLAARERAAARVEVLTGRYYVVDGELLPAASASWHAEGAAVVVDADYPGARQDHSGRWFAYVPVAQVTAVVRFTTWARHDGGGRLEVLARDGDTVRATWFRGDNNDAGETIPAGFIWEKNDDYYYGTVRWDELRDVTVEQTFLR
ncbi:hypothetical protein GCM10009682_35340 [Luedemannella flava]|uniref:Uncharacterized protein n=1 Tax=Luedemannella flava TaxID=349316 RepID=A0ABN2M6I8_9ACTN